MTDINGIINACNALLAENDRLTIKCNETKEFLTARVIGISKNYNDLNVSSRKQIANLEKKIERLEAKVKKMRLAKKAYRVALEASK
jgi:uncharacterized protein YoxC